MSAPAFTWKDGAFVWSTVRVFRFGPAKWCVHDSLSRIERGGFATAQDAIKWAQSMIRTWHGRVTE
jgi:hypothetical protein